MQAIILVGGLGTRLKSVVSNVPKPMAQILNKPFIEYVLTGLKTANITEVIFAVGYKGDMFQKYFGNGEVWGLQIKYVYEETLLGTAGAIRNAVSLIKSDSVLVLNGDTYYELDYKHFVKTCEEKESDMGIVLRRVPDVSRYGKIVLKDDLIVGFDEKSEVSEPGIINGGVYFIKTKLIGDIPSGKISLEKAMVPKWINENKKVLGFVSDAYFIDIGIPEDYFRFIKDVKHKLNLTKDELGKEAQELVKQKAGVTSTQFIVWRAAVERYLCERYGVLSKEYIKFMKIQFIPQSVEAKSDYREEIIDFCSEKILDVYSKYLSN